jgi:hypothetical protein
MCLTLGSKDNMTALIIKFKAQTIGTGGGVAARRSKREASNSHADGEQEQQSS